MYIALSLILVSAFFHTGLFFLDIPISLISLFFVALVSPLLGFKKVVQITAVRMTIEWLSR